MTILFGANCRRAVSVDYPLISYRMHQKELDAISNADERHRRLVELNVIEQCINLFKSEIVQQARVECYEQGRDVSPRIHPCIFDPNTGDLIRVKVSCNISIQRVILR